MLYYVSILSLDMTDPIKLCNFTILNIFVKVAFIEILVVNESDVKQTKYYMQYIVYNKGAI